MVFSYLLWVLKNAEYKFGASGPFSTSVQPTISQQVDTDTDTGWHTAVASSALTRDGPRHNNRPCGPSQHVAAAPRAHAFLGFRMRQSAANVCRAGPGLSCVRIPRVAFPSGVTIPSAGRGYASWATIEERS